MFPSDANGGSRHAGASDGIADNDAEGFRVSTLLLVRAVERRGGVEGVEIRCPSRAP